MTLTYADISGITALVLIVVMLLMWLAYCIGSRHGFEEGHIAGENEEAARTNAKIIKAKLTAWQQGLLFGFENRDALMSRRMGNVSDTPMQLSPRKPGTINCAAPAMQGAQISSRNEIPYKAEQRCQAVGGNAEGKAPTITAN